MFSKILVPLDRTRTSELSLGFACDIAKTHNSQIILLAVNEATQFHGEIPKDIVPCWENYCREALRLEDESIRLYMEAVFQKVSSNGRKAFWVTALGKASEQIIYFADSYDVDLIIITTHGYFRFTNYPSTSVATEVMRGIRKPLLVLGNKTGVSIMDSSFNIPEIHTMEKSNERPDVAKSLPPM